MIFKEEEKDALKKNRVLAFFGKKRGREGGRNGLSMGGRRKRGKKGGREGGRTGGRGLQVAGCNNSRDKKTNKQKLLPEKQKTKKLRAHIFS